MTSKKIELKPIYNNQVSFYKKAYFTTEENDNNVTIKLYSYNTHVLTIYRDRNEVKKGLYVLNEYSFFSSTTLKHIKEALRQFLNNTNLLEILQSKNMTKKQIEKYNKKEV